MPCCRATLCSCEICQSKGFRRMEVSNFAAVFMIRIILPMRSFENTVRHLLSGISREKMSALCWFAKWVCPFHPRAATGQCACGFGVKARAGRKNWCDFRRAIFLGKALFVPRAFHPKARSHYPITALCSFMVGCGSRGFDQSSRQFQTPALCRWRSTA